MEPIADQMLAAMEEAGGYSEMATAFHPALAERVRSLVSAPREMPDPSRYAQHELGALCDELVVRAATDNPAPYLVWARYPELNWPVPACLSIPQLGRLLLLRCADRCDWCERSGGDRVTSGLLASAGMAVALFAFCAFCRLTLSDECDADLHWIEP